MVKGVIKPHYVRLLHFFVAPIILTIYLVKYQINLNIFFIILGFFLCDSLGVQIGAHKLFSHRYFRTNKYIEIMLCWLCVMSGQGSPLSWAALHRGLHHKYTDTERDPHTPQKGVLHVFFMWYWHVRVIPLRCVSDLIRKRHVLFFHNYQVLVIYVTWLFFCLLLPFNLFISLFIVPMIMSLLFTGVLSYFLHRQNNYFFSRIFGLYRSHSTNDLSHNSILLGLLSFGTGYHNNHHAFPEREYFDLQKHEIDLSRFIIPFLQSK